MTIPFYNEILTALAKMRIAPPYIAGFDSASAMLRAIAFYLRGQDFPGLGIAPSAIEPITALINKLPQQIRETIYIYGSAAGAIPSNQLGDVSVSIWRLGWCDTRRILPRRRACGRFSGAPPVAPAAVESASSGWRPTRGGVGLRASSTR